MARQHATPLLIAPDGSATPLRTMPLGVGGHGLSEAEVQALVQAHPACLPIAEIDPLFLAPVPICTELTTPAGPIDNLMMTASALPVLVECKLWRNPEGRREVVGQILDYAKELSRWSASDLQREIGRRLKRPGNPLIDALRAAGHDIDEAAFNDALTLNLRRGRLLLLIVGDGIREGVEAIAEYLQVQAGLRFTLGLVELPVFETPDGGRLIVPRVLARTTTILREVVAAPEGFVVRDVGGEADVEEAADDATVERVRFLRELVDADLALDPDQPAPRPTPAGFLYLYMPAPANSCWISVSVRANRLGLWLTSNRNTPGEAAIAAVAQDWPAIREALGGTAALRELGPGRYVVEEFMAASPFGTVSERQRALAWLRERMSAFVAVLRPRVRDAVARMKD